MDEEEDNSTTGTIEVRYRALEKEALTRLALNVS